MTPSHLDRRDARMFRLGPVSLFGLTFFTLTLTTAADPPDHPVEKRLAVQVAMVRASQLLRENNGKLAVEVLEEQLPNGNAEYLGLLRDAYRVYIKDLYL